MKKIVTLSVLSLGILFLAGCGQQPVGQNQPTAPAPVAQQLTQSTAVATVPVDWQVYTNTKYGFEFMHPSDVGYLSPEGGTFLGYLSNKDAKETNILILGKKLTINTGEDEHVLSINSGLENKNIIMQEFIDNQDRFDVSNIDINGLKFKKYSLKSGVYNGYNNAYLFDDSNRFIIMRFIDSPLANQIISTFKFTK